MDERKAPPVQRARGATRAALAALAAIAGDIHAQPKPPAASELPRIEVIGTTPVPGIGVPREQIPSNVQIIGPAELRDEPRANTAERIGGRLPSVNLNEIQGNPFQPDINFRGFTVSPLLGTPQGLSVYQDGVRVNEGFGDVVNWDLIPQAAIESITLVPGSNPLYGLNTLGGALSIKTKTGFTSPGGEVELQGGSFERRSGEFSFGRRMTPGTALFVAGTWYKEAGWRDFSPSEVRQLFANLGVRRGAFDASVALTHGDTDLIGNGLVPQSMLVSRRETIFTRPDQTRNRLTMLTLNGSYTFGNDSLLSVLLYERRLRTRTLNGDINDGFEDGPNDAAAGGTGFAIGTGALNRTATRQNATGGAVQWSAAGRGHELTAGLSHDRSRAMFDQSTQLGVLDVTRGVVETDPINLENALTGRTRTNSVYLTDTWALRRDVHLTLSGRYNVTRVRLRDSGPSAPALDGDHKYKRFNPGAGLTYQISPALGLYGSFNQGNRAPTPIELGCADPLRPCTLPNALAADPPLNQVIARTIELGARGRIGDSLRWNAGVYRAVNTNDILFVGTTTSAGYFTNFGKTERRGIEFGLSGRAGRFDWRADYNFIRATYASRACVVAENNSSRGTSTACSPAAAGAFLGDDLIEIRPGDRIPGIPAHSLKSSVAWRASEQFRIGAELLAYSSQYVRGNENNRHQAGTAVDLNGDTRTFLGSGKAGGYALVNLHARYRLARDWEVFGRLNNLFDRQYATGGALAENPFDPAGRFQTDSGAWARETFFAPGAPRAVWIGLRARFAN